MAKYREDLDILKGIAIIAVVLYHVGITPSGYLGVDAFLVINGFLIIPGVVNKVGDGNFNYWWFLERRVVRLLPLMLIVTGLSLLVGYFCMLPDDYENLSESVVATNLFSGNIFASITAKNYWDVRNEFKPLMHTWYIGVLFEFYIVYPLIVMLLKWLSNKFNFNFYKYVIITLSALTCASLLLYLMPSISVGDRFYLLQYRFFEICLGGLAGIWIYSKRNGALYSHKILSGFSFGMLIVVIFAGLTSISGAKTEYNITHGSGGMSEPLIPQNILLLVTVSLTFVYVLLDNTKAFLVSSFGKTKIIGLLGMMSYSVYLWHQPILAFYRYLCSTVFDVRFYLYFSIVILFLSLLTYYYVEKKIKRNLLSRVVAAVSFFTINLTAFYLYMHAGVVRDVPELDIKTGEVYRNMFAKYNDRIYAYNKDFTPISKSDSSKKIKVLCVGNSFARDWGNILLESKVAPMIDLSYLRDASEKDINRIRQCDYIFFFDWKSKVPDFVWNNIGATTEVWGLGTKNFGDSNGQVYRKRNSPDYFKQTITINPNFFEINRLMKDQWGEKYVDLLSLSLAKDSSVYVFSDDNHYISQDCRHLTISGARFFAKRVDFDKIFHLESL